jgi:murein L,D-transpeptidase YafK
MWKRYLTGSLHNKIRLSSGIGKFKNIVPSLTLFAFILILCTARSHADSVKQQINQEQDLPVFLLEWQGKPDYVVVVDKSQQKVMVYRTDNLLAPEKVYQCSTGEHDGPKSERNDRRTPEGIYFFTNSYLGETLAPIYGSRALPINYPNIIDQMEGKEGYGIWFHGTNKPIMPNDTNGCVSMENKDIEELATLIKMFNTPIIISSRMETASPADIQKAREVMTGIIENWRNAWQDRDIDKYMSFYSRKFTSGGKNWRQWKENKSRLVKRYSNITVEMDDLRLLTANGVVLVTFKQTYGTSDFKSRGTKILYLTKNSDQWKIAAETFDLDKIEKIDKVIAALGKAEAPAIDIKKAETPAVDIAKTETPSVDSAKVEMPVTDITKSEEPAAEKQEPYSLQEVEDFIYSWKDSWEKEDLSRYISCYDKNFQSRGMDLAAWEKHRKALNKKYRSLKIEISELKIEPISDNSAKAAFMQNYMADNYKDIGSKELLLVKEGKDWKIIKEEWTPIKKR